MTYFYGHLFAADPEIRSMFPPAMDAQRQRLAGALRRIISGDESGLAELGRAHRKFGARDEHYETFRQALLTMLHKFTTPDEARSLAAGFDRACRIMSDAAQEDACRFPAWWTAEVTAHETRLADLAVLTLQPDAPFPYQAGQHVSVQTPRWPRQWRSYSIANAPRPDGTVTLHVRARDGGMVSSALVHRTRVGDTLLLGGAAGSMTAGCVAAAGDVLCLAGGTGLAPLKAIIEALAAAGAPGRRREIVLYYGARREPGLYDLPDLRRMELDYPWLQVLPVVSDEPVASMMHATIPAAAAAASWADREVFISGPDEMIHATVRGLVAAGAPTSRLHYDLPCPPAPSAPSPVVDDSSTTLEGGQ
jgi:NAD(P)H-flavin reductase